MQYVDYAAWQRQWLQGEVLEKRLAYWRQQLQDAPTRIELAAASRTSKSAEISEGVKHLIKISQRSRQKLCES